MFRFGNRNRWFVGLNQTTLEIVMTSPEQNPYQAPMNSTRPVDTDPVDKVTAVAKAQRLVNLAILFYLFLIPINIASNVIAVRTNGESIFPLLVLPIALAVIIFVLIAVGRLAYALHGVGNTIFYCITMLIPCVGLILLVFLNSRATNYLKRHGVKVGLMGADLSTLPSSQQQ